MGRIRGIRRRRIPTIAAVASGILFLLSMGFWVRGFFASDVWAWHRYDTGERLLESQYVDVASGWAVFRRSTTLFPQESPPPLFSSFAHDAGPAYAPLTFPSGNGGDSWAFWHNQRQPPVRAGTRAFQVTAYGTAGVRLVVVMGLSAVLPAVWTWLAVRERRVVSAGSCSECGYDLRASPERCPECGKGGLFNCLVPDWGGVLGIDPECRQQRS